MCSRMWWREHRARLIRLAQMVEVHRTYLVELIHWALSKRTGVIQLIHLIHLVRLVHVAVVVDLIDLLERRIVVSSALYRSSRCMRRRDVLLVAAPRVRVVVYSRMSRQLVRSAKSLRTSWELTSMRLFASVRSNMAGLVFKAMKRLIAERAFIWPYRWGKD